MTQFAKQTNNADQEPVKMENVFHLVKMTMIVLLEKIVSRKFVGLGNANKIRIVGLMENVLILFAFIVVRSMKIVQKEKNVEMVIVVNHQGKTVGVTQVRDHSYVM